MSAQWARSKYPWVQCQHQSVRFSPQRFTVSRIGTNTNGTRSAPSVLCQYPRFVINAFNVLITLVHYPDNQSAANIFVSLSESSFSFEHQTPISNTIPTLPTLPFYCQRHNISLAAVLHHLRSHRFLAYVFLFFSFFEIVLSRRKVCLTFPKCNICIRIVAREPQGKEGGGGKEPILTYCCL